MSSYFTPGLFAFLRELKAHNTREWFQANRARYAAAVEAPMLQFIGDLSPHLAAISPAFVVDPRRSGGSMYRIYRDTRFSPDKTPYKVHAAAAFRHEARKTMAAVPSFYLHLEVGDCFGGGGLYHPDRPALTRIRGAMVEDRKAWRAVRATGIEIEGESLSRAPAGFNPADPFIEDLRRKDLYSLAAFTQKDVCGAAFLDAYVEACRQAAPLVAFLTRALGLRW